jgi:hypothetical protein
MLRIRRRLAMWALMFIGLPVLARGLLWAAETIESRQGPSASARRLRQASLVAHGMRGRLAPRRRHWWTV